MFTFQNGDGGPEDSSGGHNNEEFFCKGVYSEIRLKQTDSIDLNENEETDLKIKNISDKSDESVDINGNYGTSFPQETCITNDVRGVLLHHQGLKKSFTLAISALSVVEVW